MALCPFARKRLIPPGTNDPKITPRLAILHVDAMNASTLYFYFRDKSGGVESHFFVRSDGLIEQYRDTAYQADANLSANDYAISIETQGFGDGHWTDKQLESIKKLLVWINSAHPDVKLAKAKTADGAGVGYHIQFGAPGPWTPVKKSCPGPNRIRQFDSVLVPWMASLDEPKLTRRIQLALLNELMTRAKRRNNQRRIALLNSWIKRVRKP